MCGESDKNKRNNKSQLSEMNEKFSLMFKGKTKSIIGVTFFFCITFLIIQVLSYVCSGRIINSVIDIWNLELYFTIRRILFVLFVVILSLPLLVGYFSCCINKSFSIKELFSFYKINKIKSFITMFIFAAIPFSVTCGILIYNLVICWRLNLFTLLFAILTFVFGTVILVSIFLYSHSPFEKYMSNIKQSYRIFLHSFTDIIRFNIKYLPWIVIIIIMIRFSYHLNMINARISILVYSRLLIFPTMYGFGLVVIPYYLLSLVNMFEKIKTGRKIKKNKDRKTQSINKQRFKKSRSKKIIIGSITLLIVVLVLSIYILFPYIRGRSLISKQKDSINNIVNYMKSNYNDGDKYACLNYNNTFVLLDQNMKPAKYAEIEDNEIIEITKRLEKEINKSIDGYSGSGVVCMYDNYGRVAVNISYYERDIPFSKSLQDKYIVYIEKGFDMSFYIVEGKLNKIDDNWYILSRTIK